MRYNIGDRIRCIDTGGYSRITMNKIYTVRARSGNIYVVIINDCNDEGLFYSDRFELVSHKQHLPEELFQL